MENSALEIIENLYKIIAEAWNVPLGNDKCIIEREKVLTQLDQLKACLPVEIAEARRLVSSRTEYMNSARKEAETLRQQTEEQVRAMIDRQAIMQEAKKRSEEMLASAERRSSELKKIASSYVDDALRQTEESMTAALESVRSTRARFISLTGGTALDPAAKPDEAPSAPAKDAPVMVEIVPDVVD